MRVSVTNLLSYDQCPRKWAFNKEGWGEHEERWPGMLQGTVVHDVVSSIAKGVQDEHIPVLVETVCADTFNSDKSIKRYSPGVVRALDKFPISWSEVRKWGSEIEVEAQIGNHTVSGRVDLLKISDDEITIVDIKTSKVDEIEHLLWNSQNRYYATILNEMYPDRTIWYEYWCLPTDAKEPSPTKGSFWMKPRNFEQTKNEMIRILDLMEKRETDGLDHKDFPRMNMNNCKFCQFKRLCMSEIVIGRYVEE